MDRQYIAPDFRDASECQSCLEREAMDSKFITVRNEVMRYRSAWTAWLLNKPVDLVQFNGQIGALLSELEEFAQSFSTAVECSRISDVVIFDQYYTAMQFGLGNALTTGVLAHEQYWLRTGEVMTATQRHFDQLQTTEMSLAEFKENLCQRDIPYPPDLALLSSAWEALVHQVATFRGSLQGWLDERKEKVFTIELPSLV